MSVPASLSVAIKKTQKNLTSGNKKKYIDGNVLLGREYKTVAGNEPWRAPGNMKELSPAHQ